MFEQSKQEAELEILKEQEETQKRRAQNAEDKTRETERRSHEEHHHNEESKHQLRLKQITLEDESTEKDRRVKGAHLVREFLRHEIEMLEIERERRLKEQEVHNVTVEAELHLEEQRIANEEKRTRAQKLLEFERQAAFLKMLPELLEKTTQNQPKIEHLRVLQVVSPETQNGTQGMGIGPIASQVVGTAQSLAYLKQLLRFLDEEA